ncbi:MAG: M56 family metallopeptidase [Bacillota bacterium]|nr:M48 family metalloprotease [Bacillota bacterium]MDW7729510.1 M56 family metallopeptidase [Bacillota bacterium]
MTAIFNEAHSLILYIIFGYSILLPLTMVSMKLLRITDPLQRLRLYLVAFLTPPAAFILYHSVLVKRCESGLTPVWAEGAFHFLCAISENMLSLFLPLLSLMIIFAAIKACVALIMIKRIEQNAPGIDKNIDENIRSIVTDISRIINITPPKVIYSSREDFAAFTTGFLKPVLVINHKIPSILSESQLGALIGHELFHVLQRDPLKNWVLHLLRDITLLNPLSALLLKGYLLEKEMICDRKAALIAGISTKEYAALLLKVWRTVLDYNTPSVFPASSFTGYWGMERRVGALLNNNQEIYRHSKLSATFLGIAIFVSTMVFLGLVC